MFSLFTNPVLSNTYIALVILNALGALYALYWNIKASGFKPLTKIRWNTVVFSLLHFIWFIALLFTPIGPALWLKIYFVLNFVTWHCVWTGQARVSEQVLDEVSIELQDEVNRRLTELAPQESQK